MSDDFDFLDEAEPVTSDEEDSVEAEVEDVEAAAERRRRRTHGVDVNSEAVDSSRDGDSDHVRHAAACRWCGSMFATTGIAEAHQCQDEPVASCRFCGEVHTSSEDPQEHLYTCESFRQHNERQVLNDGEDADNPFSDRHFIDPCHHELKAYVKYDVGLPSYYGLNSLQKEHDFEEHGALRTSMEDETGKEWGVEFSFKASGLEPRDDPSFRIENVREYLVKVFPEAYDSYADAKADGGRKKITFTVSPRWPDLRSLGDASNPSNPHDIEGFDVEYNGSNIEFGRYPEFLHRALQALREKQGFRFSNPTQIRPDDFDPDRIHESSNIVDAELYVRVAKERTRKVYAFDGTLHRVSMLLANERRGYAKTVRDDRECEGHYHTATIGDDRAAELVGGHDLAKELKHYHMKDPDAVAGTNLENPKIGASFQNSKSRHSVKWDDLDDLERELDEAVLNVLSWSDIPLRPDSGVFVSDDHFEVTGTRRFRKVISDKLPRIEAQQDRHLHAVVGNVNDTDVELLDTLLTDGGEFTPAELADRIGRHVDTVRKALDRLGGLVEHTYGDVQLGSKYLAQEIVKKIGGMADAVKSDLSGAADDLVRARLHGDGDNPWSRWLDHYVERIDERPGDAADELVLGYRPETKADAKRLLREGAGRWAQVAGEDMLDFAKEFVPSVETADGISMQPTRFEFEKLLPGYSSRYVALR